MSDNLIARLMDGSANDSVCRARMQEAAGEIEHLREQIERLGSAVIAAEALADAVQKEKEAHRRFLNGPAFNDWQACQYNVGAAFADYRKATENEQ